MLVRMHDGGHVMLVEAPAGSKVYCPVPALYDLVGRAELEQLLKIPDGGGGFHRIPQSLVAESARRGLYGLRMVSAGEETGVADGGPRELP
jgi:hypothetical protein